MGAALVATATSALVLVYVAPLAAALRSTAPEGAPAPLPALSVPTVEFPRFRVPHLVRPAPLPKPASVPRATPSTRSVPTTPAKRSSGTHRAAAVIVVDSYGIGTPAATKRRRLLDLPATEDSGYSQSDNITNVDLWHFFANTPGETAFNVTTEPSPDGRKVTYTFNADATTGCYCFYYPDSGGGLGQDGRQGTWTYQGHYEDLAGNIGPDSNTLAISFDSVAPTGTLTLAGAVINGRLPTSNPNDPATLAFVDSGGSGIESAALAVHGGTPSPRPRRGRRRSPSARTALTR